MWRRRANVAINFHLVKPPPTPTSWLRSNMTRKKRLLLPRSVPSLRRCCCCPCCCCCCCYCPCCCCPAAMVTAIGNYSASSPSDAIYRFLPLCSITNECVAQINRLTLARDVGAQSRINVHRAAILLLLPLMLLPLMLLLLLPPCCCCCP